MRARSALVFLFLMACNFLLGTSKYVVDCVDVACSEDGDGGSGDRAGAADDAPQTTQCVDSSVGVIPKCSVGELQSEIHTAIDDPRIVTVPPSDQEAPYSPNC